MQRRSSLLSLQTQVGESALAASRIKIVAIDLGSPEGDTAVEAEWRDGKLVSYREHRREPAEKKPKRLAKPRDK